MEQILRNLEERKREELVQLQAKYQNLVQEYDETSSIISSSARQEKEAEINSLRDTIIQFQEETTKELQNKQQELVEPLYEQINQAIAEIAKEKSIDYIINIATSNGERIILYASEDFQKKYDITDNVLRKMNI